MNMVSHIGDRVTGRQGGVIDAPVIPADMLGYPDDRLRVDGDAVVDAADYSTFFIDPDDGYKHIVDSSRQELACAWDDPLILDAGVWRVETPEDRLAALKGRLRAQVDQAAERERLKYITPGAGQAMTYQAKAAEAQVCLDDPDPDAADYPLLAAEIGITGATLADVAAIVAAAHAQWTVIGAAIETTRLAAKQAIDAAEDEEAAAGVFQALEWPAPQ